MASDDSSSSRSAPPILLRIKLRYEDLATMVLGFAINVGKSGLFLPTKALQPVGAELKFELRLADEQVVLVGLGRVKASVPPDPQDPDAPFGMAIELMRVTPQSRAVILRMLKHRAERGLPEIGLPMAEDVAAAREDIAAPDDQGDEHADDAERDGAADRAGNEQIEATAGAPVELVSEPLLTSPRRTLAMTGPLVAAVAPLAPEPVRRKRPAVSELIERASGPVAIAAARPGLLGLDDDVDVAAAIVRARALAGHGLDAELDALAEAAAAPVELSVEAASAELARHVGGHAVRRDRSARWVAPPVTAPPAASGPSPEGAPPLESGEHAALVNATEELPAAQLESHVGEVEPLDELDMDDAEYTDLGGIPEGGGVLGLSGRATATLPVATHTEDADQPVEPAHGVLHDPAHDLSLEELDDFEILAESEASEEELLAIDGELGLLADPPPAVAMPRTMSELDFAARLDLGDDSDPHLRAARPARSGYAAASDPHRDSAGHALAAFESGDDPLGDPDDTEAHEHSAARTGVQPIFEPETSNSFTLAGVLTDSLDLDAPSSSVQSIPTAAMPAEPAFLRDPPRPASRPRAAKLSPSLYDTPVEDHELEHALEALDVDLDDLSIPHAATHLQRGSSTSRPGPVIRPAGQTRAPPSGTRAPALAAAATSIRPGGPAPPTGRIVASRPPTDDDLVIEFEEED